MKIYNIISEYIGSKLRKFELNPFLTTIARQRYIREFIDRINVVAMGALYGP
jgi:hypothetical protein